MSSTNIHNTLLRGAGQNKKALLEEAGYKNIQEFKKFNPEFKSPKAAYDLLVEGHNMMVNSHREQKHDTNTKIKQAVKSEKAFWKTQTNTSKRVKLVDSAYKSYVAHKIPVEVNFMTGNNEVANQDQGVEVYAKAALTKMISVIQRELTTRKAVQIYTTTSVTKLDSHGKEIESTIVIPKTTVTNVNEFKEYFKKQFQGKLDRNKNENLGSTDSSGLGLGKIGGTIVNICAYEPFSGGSYKPLPKSISATKGVVNIKNNDNLCFLWCLIASRHPADDNKERVAKYNKPEYIAEWKFNEEKDMTITFEDTPMQTKRIGFFERANNVSINVYSVNDDNKTKIPIHVSKQKCDEVINLFLYDNHYSLIVNFSRFCGNGMFNCPNCLASHKRKDALDHHLESCRFLNENGTLVQMPKSVPVFDDEKEVIGFKKPQCCFSQFKMCKKLPIVIYADFESSIEECKSMSNYSEKNKKAKDVVKKGVIAKHVPNSFRLRVESTVYLKGSKKFLVKQGVDDEPNIFHYSIDDAYTGSDCAELFIEVLMEMEESLQSQLRAYSVAFANVDDCMSARDTAKFESETHCHMCCLPVTPGDKVRDHCHFTGDYLGAAHKSCNASSQQTNRGNVKIPVFFHNANYDMKCFIQAFHKLTGNDLEKIKKMNAIPNNIESYKTLNINSFHICCSYAHLSSSLDSLIKNLPEEKKIRLRSIVGDDEEKFKLINKKGLYPYELITSQKKLDFNISQLKREDFDSKLSLTKLSDDDWAHVQEVIRVFGFTDFKEYHDLYLKIDVLGLTDVFEYHRELSMKSYGLDPAHCIGLPQLTWQAGLKMTGVKLDLIQDQDMYEFFEKMKRGGISVISHKYAKANNTYLPDYDASKPSSYLMQQDCNNLYGWAMMQKLPTGDFKWKSTEEWSAKRILEMEDDCETGYAFEVDLEYPKELHDEHNDYPLAPEKILLDKTIKLAPNFNDKKNYVVHHANLKYYLEKGLRLTKIHRVVEFHQCSWLKVYIDKNSKMRQAATNDFEKDFYKLMNNAFFGKTMENVRDRVEIKFTLTEKQFNKAINNPRFASHITCFAKGEDEGLRLVRCHKKVVNLDKPLYVGASIMELSKVLMYKFHYDTMKKIYPEALMMKTDTDSLLYFIQTEDLYKDFKENALIQSQLEFSNYPKTHPLYNCERKKVPGLFQDECVDGEFLVISEYSGLRAKCYANHIYNVDTETYQTKKKAKGVPKTHVKKRLTFEDYKQTLGFEEGETELREGFKTKIVRLGEKADIESDQIVNRNHEEKIYSFRSFGMCTYSVEMSKVALSSNDNKRVMTDDGIHTLAIGHKRLRM